MKEEIVGAAIDRTDPDFVDQTDEITVRWIPTDVADRKIEWSGD